jgi:predicted lactoylglutathione lyase
MMMMMSFNPACLICGLVCQSGTLLLLTMTKYIKWTKLNVSEDKDKDQLIVALTTKHAGLHKSVFGIMWYPK